MAGTALKRRIKSVTNTRKITKAMGLVATAKLRKTKELLEKNNVFYDTLGKMVEDAVTSYVGDNPYIYGNEATKKLYIVMTSDSGLCGSFNVNILSRAAEEISKDKEDSLVMVVGEKGISYFNRFNYKTNLKYTGLSDLPTMKEAKTIADAAVNLYLKGEVSEINVIYSEFAAQNKTEVIVKRLLPILTEVRDDSYSQKYIELEPNIESLIDSLIPFYVRESILNLLINSKTSEQAIRMSAMDGATKNANELLDKLKLQYNRQRQGAITQEISEIVGGAEAQK